MTISPRPLEEQIWRSIISLDAWLDDHGWAGYDPYDLKGTKLYLGLMGQGADASLPARALWKGLVFLEDQAPGWTRKILGVKKQINPKAMGLFARGYLDLYQTTKKGVFKEKAHNCLDWLLENPSKGHSGFGWGYPFDWQSVIFIPRETPSAVVSSLVGDAFWRAFEVFGDQRYLDVCDGICQFFLDDLNKAEMEDGVVCFSYTPLDDFQVHNANLFVAEFLTRVGLKLDQKEYQEWGQRAANFALQEQNPDGSLFYWGKAQNHHSPDHIDHYHSGFEIRLLHKLWKWTGDPRYFQAAERYFNFYCQNLISWNGDLARPKMKPDALYPIDVHACAESLLLNATLAEDFGEARRLLPALTAWILANMQTDTGWFIYRIQEGRDKQRRVEIPFMRWGQAWMLRALASAYGVMTSE